MGRMRVYMMLREESYPHIPIDADVTLKAMM